MKDLHYSRVWHLPVDQISSLLALNKSNNITLYKKGVNFAYYSMSLSVGLDLNYHFEYATTTHNV